MMQRTPVRKISAKRLAALGGIVPYSTIARPRAATPKKQKAIPKIKARGKHWNPIPGALDPRSHFTKDGREKLYGVDKTSRRREIFERSGGRCEVSVSARSSELEPIGIQPRVRCYRIITWENFEWSHKRHGANKTDTLDGGIASCKECHRRFHNSGKGDGQSQWPVSASVQPSRKHGCVAIGTIPAFRS